MKRGIQGLKIERAAPADLESAYKVFEESIAAAFAQEGISQDAPAEIEYKKQLIRSSVHEDASAFIFFVAKVGGKVVGTISYGPCGDDIRRCLGEELEDLGELGSIYVLPGFQGRGVASALIAAMLEYLQSRGVRRFYLDCGLKAAQEKWLREFGQPCKRVKDYWGEGSDHLIWLCAVEDFIV
ncbi:GNAT family N-acetyltransferase [Candidatus Darwinibacter acetoxidans]